MKRRANGSGTLVKKPNGTYMAKWTFRGKTYTKSTGTANYNSAMKFLNDITRPFQEESKVDVLLHMEAKVKSSVIKMNEVKAKKANCRISDLQSVIENSDRYKEIAKRSQQQYDATITRFSKWIADNAPNVEFILDVNELVAGEFLSWLLKRCANRTYNSYLKTLIAIWNQLSNNGQIFENVWKANFKMKKMPTYSERRALSKDEIMRLFQACRHDDERWLIMLLLYTGARLGDVCNFRWSDYDMEANIISFVPRKTKRFRNHPVKIPLHRSLLRVLKDAYSKRGKDDEYILPNMQRLYSNTQIRRVRDRLFRRAKIDICVKDERGHRKYVTGFHALRRNFVDYAINAGMNPFLVQHIVGHRSIDMTAYYYDLNRDEIAKGIAKLPEYDTDGKLVQAPSEPSRMAFFQTVYDPNAIVDDKIEWDTLVDEVWGKGFKSHDPEKGDVFEA